jgi:hypothetical protein
VTLFLWKCPVDGSSHSCLAEVGRRQSERTQLREAILGHLYSSHGYISQRKRSLIADATTKEALRKELESRFE